MEQTNPGLRSWSITSSEWFGYGRSEPRSGWLSWTGNIVNILIGCAFLAAPFVFRSIGRSPPTHFWLMFGVLGATFLLGPALLMAWSRRQERRWRAIQSVIWESNGCVCPWCRVRVDEVPCPKHGFNRDDQPKLLAYWECLPQHAHADVVRATELLTATARRRPRSWFVLGPLRRMAYAARRSQHDERLTPLQRLRGGLPWMTVKLIASIAVMALAYQLLPSRFIGKALCTWWPLILFGPIMLMSGPMWRKGKLRCTACSHICASAQPTLCTECGADLTQPAAVVRYEVRPNNFAIVYIVPFLLLGLSYVFSDAIVRRLPDPIRNAIWTKLNPPNDYWQKLNPSTMTDAEIATATQLLIKCAAPGGPRPLFDFAFLESLQKAGRLTPATLESAARMIAQATLEVAQADGRVTATVSPAFGEQIMPGKMTPRLVFCGASVDDGVPTPPAEWSLFHDDIEEFWRANSQLPALPEEKLVFRADLGTLPAGEHRVRARCLIVLHEMRWVRYKPSFDERGELLAPAGAQVYELPLEATVTVK